MADRSSPEIFPEDVVPGCGWCNGQPLVDGVEIVTIWCPSCKRTVSAPTPFQALEMWSACNR